MSDEIRSTMEMVLKRAAEMTASTNDSLLEEKRVKDGMRLAAAFLRGENVSLTENNETTPANNQRSMLKGIVQSLLRNIFLPREDDQKNTVEKAMHGLVEISHGDRQLLGVFGEMKKITDGYLQHRDQLKAQLEQQFARQMEMMEQNLARQTGVAMKLQPSQHPKFQEEWARLKEELNDQYANALEQLKEMVGDHFA
jgi:hypothetical protein